MNSALLELSIHTCVAPTQCVLRAYNTRTYARARSAHARTRAQDPPTNVATQTATTHADIQTPTTTEQWRHKRPRQTTTNRETDNRKVLSGALPTPIGSRD